MTRLGLLPFATPRHARGALFAYAARKGCRVRSVDLVAAYLQGRFVDGEVVYCYLPTGYTELDSNGQPLIARVEKPIYGIQQAGRRLQRMLFAWLVAQGFHALDDSDPCVFTRVHPDGEIITIGVYVDNLQIVHSAVLDADAFITFFVEANPYVTVSSRQAVASNACSLRG